MGSGSPVAPFLLCLLDIITAVAVAMAVAMAVAAVPEIIIIATPAAEHWGDQPVPAH